MMNQDFFEGSAIASSRYWEKFQRLRAAEAKRGRPLLMLKGDQMLVEKLPPVEIKLPSGIIYSGVDTHKGTMADAATEFGLVLATGPGTMFEDGTEQPCDSKPGDVVMLPGNVFWYSMFGHLAPYHNYTIGRVRDAQIPMWTTDYELAFKVLNTPENDVVGVGDEP